jgi:hypothetical protein
MAVVINVHSEPDSSEVEFWGDIVDTHTKMQQNAVEGLLTATKAMSKATKKMIDAGFSKEDTKHQVDLFLDVWEAK